MKCTMLIIFLKVVRAEYYVHRPRLLVQNKMRWMLLVMLGDRATVVYKVQYMCQ